MASKKLVRFVYIVITLLGILLRFYGIENQSLWWDEGYSYDLANDINDVGIHAFSAKYQGNAIALSSDKTQVLFHILVSFLPKSWAPEWRMRFWSAITASLTLIFILLIVFKLDFNLITKLLILIFASFSPFHIYYAQEGRPYALLLFVLTIFIYCIYKYPNIKTYFEKLLISVTIILLGMIQFIGLVLPFSYTVYLVAKKKNRQYLYWWVQLWVFCTILLSPIIFLVFMHHSSPLPRQDILIRHYLYACYCFLVGFTLGPSNYELHLNQGFSILIKYLPTMIAVLFSISISLITCLRTVIQKRKNIILYFVSFIILILLGIAYLLKIIPLYPRHLIVLFPFFILMLAYGIGSIKNSLIRNITIVIVILLLIRSDFNYYFNKNYYKDDIRTVAQIIMENELDGDVIYIGVKSVFLVYYHGSNRVINLERNDQLFFNEYNNIRDKSAIWVVINRPWDFDQNKMKDKLLRLQNYTINLLNINIYTNRKINKIDKGIM